MIYAVQDTSDGYVMLLQSDQGRTIHVIEEKGGHGPVEQLYAQISSTYTRLRAEEANAQQLIGDV